MSAFESKERGADRRRRPLPRKTWTNGIVRSRQILARKYLCRLWTGQRLPLRGGTGPTAALVLSCFLQSLGGRTLGAAIGSTLSQQSFIPCPNLHSRSIASALAPLFSSCCQKIQRCDMISYAETR